MSCTMYRKRAGTSGISGQLYESKLISLLYFRALHDNRIIDFKLASNVDGIGAFDDICFKAEVEGFDKPIAVFLQAKHKENKKQIFKIDLDTYFSSYLKIRQCFDTSKKDLFFKGTYGEVECLFVLYTTARDEFINDSKVESKFCFILDDLIGTGGTAKQPYKQDEDIKFLCKVAMQEQMTSLAERMAKFINDDSNYQMILIDELILCYHVILGEKVVNVSEVQPDGCRIASFRHDFFDTHEEYLIHFKNTLLFEILKKRKIEPAAVKHYLSEFLTEPTDALKLSRLIGINTTYNNGQLEFNKQNTKGFLQEMKPIPVSRSTFNKAVELAAKEILLSPKFKLRVPSAFGNKDITLSGSDTKKKRRINHLALKIIDLLLNCNSSKIITIDESLGDGFLQLNGGIAGAVGNILVLDDITKLMKITNNKESLGTLAKQLYERLNEEIEIINKNKSDSKISNLSEYKFCFKVNKIPKLLLECSEHEEKARDFLNQLVIYSTQADETGVEEHLKREIEENQLNQPNYLQAKTDAIFAKFHDEIQKWWMRSEQAPYLTRKSDLFQNAKNIIKDKLLSVIHVMYRSKINYIMDYTFSENAVKALNLQDQLSSTIITTDNSVLTVVKVMQHLKNKSHTVLDLEYVINLPPQDRNVLRTELRDTHNDTCLILVCDEIKQNKRKILENITETVLNKNSIIVTKHTSLEIFKKCFSKPYILHDKMNTLNNMSEESQKSILERAKVMFQDTVVRLGSLVDEKSKMFVKGDILHRICNKEIIAVGKLTVKRNYDEIKHYHVERRIKKYDRKPPSNPIMYYLSNNKANPVPTSVTILNNTDETQSDESSDETLEEKSSVLTAVVKTLDNTLDEKQGNEVSDKTHEEQSILSNEVVKTLDDTLDENQRNKVSDRTVEENSSFSNEVLKILDNTPEKIQTNELFEETLEEKSNTTKEFSKTLDNNSEKKRKKEFSDRPLEEESILATAVVNTPGNILDEKQKNKVTDEILEETSSISTEVVKTLDNTLDQKQRNKVFDETLEEGSSLLTTVIKRKHREKMQQTLEEAQKIDDILERKLSISGVVVETLNMKSDIPEDVVLVTAEPGMGKSTLLTYLSIKTKNLKPEIWIIRINLLEYSEEFSKWKEGKTAIDLLETLNFMCQVIIREKLGKKNEVEFKLEEKDNVVYLKNCIAEPLIEFELNLFLHFFCEREMIFAFDGFDEICPHYADVVIKCLKCVSNHPRKHRMWITSRSYNEVKIILENEFGPSYEIDYFSTMEMEKYLYTFWEFNLRLEDLKIPQLENVREFLEYMSVVNWEQIPVAEPLYDVIKIAACYLSNEIKNKHIPLWKYDKNYFEIICYKPLAHDQIYDANPLFLNLAAFYVAEKLKKEHRKFEEWYVDFDTFTVYKSFLENKIKRRYQEKNEINIYNSDIIIAYEKELTESIFNHKRLGAYAVFNKYHKVLFCEKDIKEIKDMIKVVEEGVEKTGLVDSVANGIPIFTHMSFTEYFAVEYVCDCLKDGSNDKQLIFIAVMFTGSVLMNVRKIFDHKIKFDKMLMSILEGNLDVIFNWIWGKTQIIYDLNNTRKFVSWPFLITVIEHLKQCELLFSKTIDFAIQNSNITEMVDISELSNLFNIRSYVNQFEHFLLNY